VTPELSRPFSLSKITRPGMTVVIHATPEECAALAIRMDLPAIRSLECFFDLTVENDAGTISAQCRLHAEVTQICVVSTEEFEAAVDDAFKLRFVPAGKEHDDPDPNQPDEIPYQYDTIDLGEAAAEQLGLALDPYPRIDGAVLPATEDDANGSPFSVLSRLAGPDRTGR
jgi:hypothetical protein